MRFKTIGPCPPPPQRCCRHKLSCISYRRGALFQKMLASRRDKKVVVAVRNGTSVASYSFACEYCDRTFASKPLMQSHLARAHGMRNPIRKYMISTVCQICRIDYHDRDRLFNHLSNCSEACKIATIHMFVPLSNEQAKQLDSDAVIARHARKLSRSPTLPSISRGPSVPLCCDGINSCP